MSKLILFCISVFLIINLISAKAATTTAKFVPVVRLDSSERVVKLIPASAFDKYRKSKDFKYQEKAPEKSGFFQYILSKILNFLGRVISANVSETAFYIIKIAFLILFIGLFVFLLIVLFGADLQGILAKSKSNKLNIPVITEDNIEGFDFDKVIRSEIDTGNYNRAVRYLYLKLLQTLTVNNLIVWQKEKTNRDYFRELLGTNYSIDFRVNSSAYEYVWYGKFPLERAKFEGIYQNFNDFYKKLNG